MKEERTGERSEREESFLSLSESGRQEMKESEFPRFQANVTMTVQKLLNSVLGSDQMYKWTCTLFRLRERKTEGR